MCLFIINNNCYYYFIYFLIVISLSSINVILYLLNTDPWTLNIRKSQFLARCWCSSLSLSWTPSDISELNTKQSCYFIYWLWGYEDGIVLIACSLIWDAGKLFKVAKLCIMLTGRAWNDITPKRSKMPLSSPEAVGDL